MDSTRAPSGSEMASAGAAERPPGMGGEIPWRGLILFALAFYACAELGRVVSSLSAHYVNFWLPAGIYIGVLLLNKTRDWPWFVLAALPANIAFELVHGTALAVALGFYSANTLESLAGAWLVRRFVAERPLLSTVKEYGGFLALAAVSSTLVGALAGASVLVASGLSDSFVKAWQLWWSGNAMIVCVTTPFMLTWLSAEARREHSCGLLSQRWPETLLLATGLVLIPWYSIGLMGGITSPYKAWIIPFLLWAGLRFGVRGATAANLLNAVAAAFFTAQSLRGHAPGDVLTVGDVLVMQFVLVLASMIGLVPAIVLKERDHTLEQLRASDERFGNTFEHAAIGMACVGIDGRWLKVNPALCAMTGYTAGELLQRTFQDITHPDDYGVGESALRRMLAGEITKAEVEKRYVRKDGHDIWATVSSSLVRSGRGDPLHFIVQVHDITERKRHEREIQRLNRVHAVLSQINECIVREKDRQTILGAACQIAVDTGGFRMAWIGLTGDTPHLVELSAHAGADLATLEIMRSLVAADPPSGCAFTQGALQSGRHQACNDIAHDSQAREWRDAALQRGYHSMAALPLKNAERTIGVFCLYAGEAGFFDAKELALLDELAVDISFALEVLDREGQRQRAERALQASENRFRALIEQAPVAVRISRFAKTIYVNEKFLSLFGYDSVDELVGQPVADQWAPEFREMLEENAHRRARGEPVRAEYEGVGLRKDGSRFPTHVAVGTVDLPDGPASLGFISDITERKRADEAYELFRALVDHADDTIEILDPQTGRFLDVSDKALLVHGYTREEHLALTVFDIDPVLEEGGFALWNANVEKVRTAGAMVFESRHRRKDGTIFPVEVSATYVRMGRDYILAVVRDISERRRAEQHIQRLNRLYAVLSEINELIVREKDPEELLETACVIAVNTGRFRLAWIGLVEAQTQKLRPVASAGTDSGYLDTVEIDLDDASPGDWLCVRALRSGVHQVVNDPDDAAFGGPERDAALTRGYRAAAAFPLKVGDRAVGAFTLYAGEAGFFDADELHLLDELAGDIGFGLEVHQQEVERRLAEQSLRSSERQFASAFDHAAIGKALVALDGRWLRVNRAVCQMLGYTEHELYAKTFQDITHPDDLEADLDNVRKLLAGEVETYQMEKRYHHKDGHVIWGLLSVSLLRDDSGRPVHFISEIQDISERRKIEEQLRQAQKMEAIGQLAGGVAHDFNNILAVIMMQADFSAGDDGVPPYIRDGLNQIRAAAERAGNLTRQLLLFSRKQMMQPLNVDLNDVVSNLAKMLQRLIREDVRLQLHLHPTPLMTHADAGMLDQVLLNLAVNARDAMPGGGTLLIETGTSEVDGALAASDPDVKPGRYVWLSVADTGEGIPADVLPHIFEPFFTTKEPGKGTGLGLATVFGIVKQHHGFLRVEPGAGGGTRFQVFLPASPVAPGAHAAAAAEKPRGGSETILLVEDEEAVRSLTRAILEQNGYRVLECANGLEALKLWERQREAVALLLTDLVMPAGLNGHELALRLWRDRPELKVIFMSGYSAEFTGRQTDLKPGENFLQKPFAPALLLETIRRSLDAPRA